MISGGGGGLYAAPAEGAIDKGYRKCYNCG